MTPYYEYMRRKRERRFRFYQICTVGFVCLGLGFVLPLMGIR